MTDKTKNLLEYLNKKEYRQLRNDVDFLLYGDDFGFYRRSPNRIRGSQGNMTPNYKRIIESGFDKIKEQIRAAISSTDDEGKKEYGKSMLTKIDEAIALADTYRDIALASGNERLYNALLNIPRQPAESFYEACVFLKLCVYMLRDEPSDHIGFGRFDQYMYSYYLSDKAKGVSDEEILETLENFFISINFDTDLYSGVQQGDNGQSMVLGGYDKDGKCVYNELSRMCMQASLELSLIDPKINLRVNKDTPDEIYEFATMLTKQGLGFPQYCNDDVVVPGLVKLGYDLEDAYDYVVAACWEFIIPGKGFDAPNIRTMNFPGVTNDAIKANLLDCDSFDALLDATCNAIKNRCDELIESCMRFRYGVRPFCSIFFDGCIESLTDMGHGGTKYLNFGCHGLGIANAADALAAVKKAVYDDKAVEKQALLDALENNFEGYEDLRNLLRECPKMGNNDDCVDDIASAIMSAFSSNMNNRDNGQGGIWRAGTGSAMDYFRVGSKCPATADGRLAATPYSSSFSPSLDVKTTGLLSVILSFTKFDMTNIINGGPLTLELHDTVLRNDEGIKKTAQLVKTFIQLGGHQLQLNSINRDRLLDAQKHPENYPNLIVRVWGWSGYFNELDLPYQEHVIRRTEYYK